MSQIVQVEDIKAQVAGLQPQPTLVPQHPFRLGFAAPEKHHTPRRSVDDVLISRDIVRPGDRIVILMGSPIYQRAKTNLLRVHRVRTEGA